MNYLESKDRFKILSLDGGGVKGYLSILILEKLEKGLKRKFNDDKNIGERFDLILGTSTGGIIAAGLAIGKSAKEIRELYEDLLKKIFTPHKKGLIKPKYNQKILKKVLEEILEDKTFLDVKTHLCLTSVDIATGKHKFFKSAYKDIYTQRVDESLLNAVMATSAAPTFFPLQKTKYFNYLADGGLVANNPSMIGIIDGYSITNDFDKVSLVSIGTGNITHMPYDVEKIKNDGGMFSWILDKKASELTDLMLNKKIVIPLIEVLLTAQANLISDQVDKLLHNNYIRINPSLPTAIDMDDISKIDILKNVSTIGDKEKIINKVYNLIN